MSETPNAVDTVVLEVRGLVKQFQLHAVGGRIVNALRGVDLTVSAGEHVALAGASGAGKSTLLKSIYRTYLPSDGSVILTIDDGRRVDLTHLADAALAHLRGLQIGYVSQFLRAEPRRGAFDIVRRAGIRRGMSGAEAGEAATRALRRLQIDEALWDVYTSVLSGGEKQRVNLAAGTISPPRVLLLDEPVSALDPANREAALELIGELAEQGVAVLSVFHDLDAMHRVATRVVVLGDGVVLASGTPSDILPGLVGVAR